MDFMPTEAAELAEEAMRILNRLAAFSEGDQPPGGVTRLLYSKAWIEGQRYLASEMERAGLSVKYDNVGNLYGKLPGRFPEAPAVLTGSHVDTVRSGGKFDGAYGIAAGITAIAYLFKKYGAPVRPLEVVSFCEEEGSRFPIAYWGSGNVAGTFDWQGSETELCDADGVPLGEAMKAAGFGRQGGDGRRTDLAAFVELHVEQGMVLERTEKRIGIVETIVGQRRYSVSLEGEANHAGTTPMTMRADAMAGAAEMVFRLENLAVQWGGPLVATAGKISAAPNVPNVIAGTVEFTLDVRHADEWKLSAFCELLMSEVERIAQRRGLSYRMTPWVSTQPVPMSPSLSARAERICLQQSLSCRRMASGAGHDAQMLAKVCPTAMIFVPSRSGISHSPQEYTSPSQLADGLVVLASMLYELAYEELSG